MKKLVLSLAAVATISTTTTITASAEEVVVNSGDTLWGIAQENDVTIKEIKELNNLPSNIIQPNQRLTLNREDESKAPHEPVSSKDVYTVVPGDSLWKIGQEHDVTVDELMSWNNLDSITIYPNDKLTVNGPAVAQNESQSVDSSQPTEPKQKDVDQEQKTMTMEATAYTAHCEGCSGITSTGINLLENPDRKVIAVDPDVIPLGTEVYVEGYGKAVAGDIGSAIQGNKIDVFIPSQSEAMDWGRKNVEVTILG